jgi:hypothetical protein
MTDINTEANHLVRLAKTAFSGDSLWHDHETKGKMSEAAWQLANLWKAIPSGDRAALAAQAEKISSQSHDWLIPNVAVETDGSLRFTPSFLDREFGLKDMPYSVIVAKPDGTARKTENPEIKYTMTGSIA